MVEDLGKITGYSGLGLTPTNGNTLQLHSVVIHDFETAYCDALSDGNFLVTHIESNLKI